MPVGILFDQTGFGRCGPVEVADIVEFPERGREIQVFGIGPVEVFDKLNILAVSEHAAG